MKTRFFKNSLWLIGGASIGAGATWLFGTRSGRKARRQMARMVEDGRERLGEAGHDVLEKGKEAFERGKEYVEETGHRVASGLRIAR